MTTLGRIQINKERNIAAPDKVWGNPTQKSLFIQIEIFFRQGSLHEMLDLMENKNFDDMGTLKAYMILPL